MPTYRKVDAQRAGPSALGILVPPGSSTLVILRPRGLDWDLLPARWEGDAAKAPIFCEFGRDEAAHVARQLQKSLEQSAGAGDNPVEIFGNPLAQKYQVWLRQRAYVWILCRRSPGQAYEPQLFGDNEDAERAARRLTPFFHPALDANQEYYFNTQNFSR